MLYLLTTMYNMYMRNTSTDGITQAGKQKGFMSFKPSTQNSVMTLQTKLIMPSENFTSMNLITVNLINMINGSV